MGCLERFSGWDAEPLPRELPVGRGGDGAGFARRARSGMRVDAAIHRIALGKSERPMGTRLRPALETMACESKVAIDIPRLS